MNYTDKKHLINALFAAWNTHDLERIAAFYAPHCQGHDVAQAAPIQGIADIYEWITKYLQAVPDMRVLCEQIILEDERAVAIWQGRGTHQGSLLHMPPTYKEIRVRGAMVLTFEGDKISHMLHIWDVAGMLRDIGFLPDL